MTTTPVPGHPFVTNGEGTPLCEDCGLPEANRRHRGAFVAVIEVHANTRQLLAEEVNGIIEFVANRDDPEVWTQTTMPSE